MKLVARWCLASTLLTHRKSLQREEPIWELIDYPALALCLECLIDVLSFSMVDCSAGAFVKHI